MELGYQLAASGRHERNPLSRTWTRLLYRQFLELKLPGKQNRVLRVFKPLTSKEVDGTVLVNETVGARIPTAPGISSDCDATRS